MLPISFELYFGAGLAVFGLAVIWLDSAGRNPENVEISSSRALLGSGIFMCVVGAGLLTAYLMGFDLFSLVNI